MCNKMFFEQDWIIKFSRNNNYYSCLFVLVILIYINICLLYTSDAADE